MVTNVGAPRSTYNVQIKAPQGTTVVVRPKTLPFSKVNQKANYSVTFTSKEVHGEFIQKAI